MPHSSDSEAFESADEDVVQADRNRRPNKPSSSSPATISRLADRTGNIQLLADGPSKAKRPADIPEPGDKSVVPEKAETVIAEDKANDGWDDWDDEADQDANKTSVDDVKIKASDKPENDADNWDKWSDEDDDNYATKPDPQSTQTATKPAAAVNLQSKPNPLDKLAESVAPAASASGWGWSAPWGGVVTNLLSTASDGVASITSHVTSAIETGMGVPGPEEMARIRRAEERQKSTDATPDRSEAVASTAPEQQQQQQQQQSSDGAGGEDGTAQLFGQLVSGVTHIGSRVITGGLGTLEGIGKKTMAVLQENDPGLRNKRRMLKLDGQAPVLSQMLREAKESSEQAERDLQLVQKQKYKKQLHFETLFDDYHGLVHLEALEMLSRQSTLKLQSLVAPLAGRALEELQETLDEVKELCELPDESETEDSDGQYEAAVLKEKIAAATEDLDVPIDFEEIVTCWQSNADWLAIAENQQDAQQLHDKGLRCLAETTALAVHKLHKLAELLLVKERHSTANEADALVQLVVTLCWHLGGIAARFGRELSRLETAENVNDLITSTFLEGSNSISYIQNGFQLFVPILQMGAA